MGIPRQEYWSGLPFPSLGDLPDPGIEPRSPALVGRFFTTEPAEKARDHITHREMPIEMAADFSSVTMKARRKWHSIFQELHSINEWGIKTFSSEEKLKQFITSRPTPDNWLKEVLQIEKI